MNSRNLGKKLREIRKSQGLTLEEMSEKLGISSVYLSEIERGNKQPKLSTFIDIANTLGVSADYLLSDVVESAADYRMNDITRKIADISAKDLTLINSVIDAILKNLQK